MSWSQKVLFIPLLLVSYEIATYLSNDMYLPALPQMMSDLGLSLKEIQLTLTIWFIGSASMPLVAGILADRFGRRPVLLVGGWIYIVATLLCAIAANLHTLLVGRLMEGAMVPMMLVPGYACIHESYEHKEAIKILATMASVSVLAPALGPLFGSAVLLFAPWPWIFVVIMIWALVCIALLTHWLPETLPVEKRQPLNLARLATTYWRVISNLRFMQCMFAVGFVYAGFLTWVTAGPLLIMLNFHYSGMIFGVIQAVVFAAYIYGNKHVKVLLEAWPVKKMIYAGMLVTLLGGAVMVIAACFYPANIFPFLGGVIIYSYGSALSYAPLNRLTIEMSNEPMGVRVAMFTVAITAFAALGSGMASLFFDGSIKSLAFIITAAIAITCVLISTGIKHMKPVASADEHVRT